MNCELTKVEGSVFACANSCCGRIVKIERAKPSQVRLPCRGTAEGDIVPDDVVARAREIASRDVIDLSGPPYGPGTEFRKLAASLGYEPKGCACNATEAKMNRLGVDGCRRNIESLCGEVVANASNQGVMLPREMAWYALDEACRLAELNAPQTPESPAA